MKEVVHVLKNIVLSQWLRWKELGGRLGISSFQSPYNDPDLSKHLEDLKSVIQESKRRLECSKRKTHCSCNQ